MALATKIYFALNGTTEIIDPTIANTDVLKVKREGLGFDIILTGVPGNRQVTYTSTSGKLKFLNPFDGTGPAVGPVGSGSEKVYVLYKTT